MPESHKVVVYDLPTAVEPHRAARTSPWRVRWKVDGQLRSRSFRERYQADDWRARLLTAHRDGTPFDVASGWPVTFTSQRGGGPTCYAVAQGLLTKDWSDMAAKSRKSLTEALAHVVASLLTEDYVLLVDEENLAEDQAGQALKRRHAIIRTLSRCGLAPGSPPPSTGDERRLLEWLPRVSRPVATVDAKMCRAALKSLSVNVDGSIAAPNTLRRRRAALSRLLVEAVELGLLPASPLPAIRYTRADTSDVLDPARVGTADDAFAVLDAVRSSPRANADRSATFLCCIYLAGLRPGEVAALRAEDLVLPVGPGVWGTAEVRLSAASAGSRWTDSGQVRDSRQPKHRRSGSLRSVPLPPALVRLLQEHLDGRREGYVFTTKTGRQVSERDVGLAWSDARDAVAAARGWPAAQLARPYDLRHSAASLWLTELPIAEVARRLGHSVETCRRVYEHALPTDRDVYNARLDALLAVQRAPAEAATEVRVSH